MIHSVYIVYILKSLSQAKHYTGHGVDLETRLGRHNRGLVKSTKAARPWKIVYTEVYSTKQQAYRRERQIKSYKGGMAFRKLLEKVGKEIRLSRHKNQ